MNCIQFWIHINADFFPEILYKCFILFLNTFPNSYVRYLSLFVQYTTLGTLGSVATSFNLSLTSDFIDLMLFGRNARMTFQKILIWISSG